jgi:hypothetical protein
VHARVCWVSANFHRQKPSVAARCVSAGLHRCEVHAQLCVGSQTHRLPSCRVARPCAGPRQRLPRTRMASSSRQCSFDCTQVRDLRQAPRPCRCASWRAGSMVLREDAYLRILRRHLVENSSSSYRTPAQFPRAIRQRDLGGLDQSRFCDIAFLKALPRKEREKWRICGSRTRTKPKRGNVNG